MINPHGASVHLIATKRVEKNKTKQEDFDDSKIKKKYFFFRQFYTK